MLVLLREMLAVDADGVCRRRKEKRRERDDEDDESETAGGTRVTVERMFRTLLKVCGATVVLEAPITMPTIPLLLLLLLLLRAILITAGGSSRAGLRRKREQRLV